MQARLAIALTLFAVFGQGCLTSSASFRRGPETRQPQSSPAPSNHEASAEPAPTPKAPEPDKKKKEPAPKIVEVERTTAMPAAELAALAKELGVQHVALDHPERLGRFFQALGQVRSGERSFTRALHLGDSHVAADYITRAVRDRLQTRFGDAGRGFLPIDQRAGYGGRRLDRKGWTRLRIVDPEGAGKPFGISGMSLESKRPGASVEYELEPDDAFVSLYFQEHPKGGTFTVFVDSEDIAKIATKDRRSRGKAVRISIPEHVRRGQNAPKKLRIVTQASGVRLYGIGFEANRPGVLYDSIGPVGADAQVYLSFEQRSFGEHLKKLGPDLVVLMIGGNDALVIRQGRRTLEDVDRQHRTLIAGIRKALPGASCLVLAPMDAGERTEDGRVVSKSFIAEVRDIQEKAANDLGCAFWDTFEAMGGPGAFGRWLEKDIMNEDLVHPRAIGGDLLGFLFAQAILEAFAATD